MPRRLSASQSSAASLCEHHRAEFHHVSCSDRGFAIIGRRGRGHRSFKNEERRAGFSSKAASNNAFTASQLWGCVAIPFRGTSPQSDGAPALKPIGSLF
jgi:hypothetical protein